MTLLVAVSAVLLLGLNVCSGKIVSVETSFTGDDGNGNINKKESVSLQCKITNDDGYFKFGFRMEWFKKQSNDEDEWTAVCSDSVHPPFNNVLYSCGSTEDLRSATTTLTFNLQISNVESHDSGRYMCRAGYTYDTPNKKWAANTTESNILVLTVTPGMDETTSMSLRPPVPAGNTEINFNEPQAVECEGQAETTRDEFALRITLGSSREVTQDFESTREVSWSGETGLKKPMTKLVLKNTAWMPESAGSGTLTCFLDDADNTLQVQSFKYVKDETAQLQCRSNYERRVRYKDIDLVISCKVLHYKSSLADLEARWMFSAGDMNVTLKSGEKKEGRLAVFENGEYQLQIPRVTLDMVSSGREFVYRFSVLREGSVLASTTYPLQIDTTRPVSGAPMRSAGVLIGLSLLLYKLIL